MKNRFSKYRIPIHFIIVFFLLSIQVFSISCSDLPEERKIRIYSSDSGEEEAGEIESFLITGLPPQAGGTSVLVLPFTDITPGAEGKLSGSAAEVITFLMRQYPDLNVYYMEELFPSSDLPDGVVTETMLTRILDRDILDYYIEGNVTETGNEYTLSYTIVDAKSQATTKEEEIVKNRDQVVELINEAGSGMYSALIPDSEEEFTPINTSLSAFSNFVKGIRAEEAFDILTAMGYYIESLVEDNSFGKVYGRIISLYFKNEEFFEDVDIEFFLREASNYRDQMNDSEKLTFSAYHSLHFGKFDESLSLFRSLTEMSGNDPEGYIGLMKVYLELGQPEQALETASTYTNNSISDVYLLKLQSRAYSMIGRFDEALNLIDTYVEMDSMNIIPLMEKSRLLFNWGRETEAVEVLDVALKIDSSAVKPRLLLSSIYISSMDFKKNINNLSSYIENTQLIEPEKLLEVMLNLFISYTYTGQYNNAINIGDDLIRIGSGDRSQEYPLWLSTYVAFLQCELGQNDKLFDILEPYIRDSFKDPTIFTLLSIMTLNSSSEVLISEFNDLYDSFIGRERRAGLYRNIRSGFENYKQGNFSQAVIDLKKVQEYEYNPLVGYYIFLSLIEQNDLKGSETEIDNFYNNLALEKFETSIALPRFYHAQALLFEKKGMTDKSSNVYRNLSDLWELSDDEMQFKQQIMNKLR